MSHDYDLNDHVYRLLLSEPFFAAVSRMVSKTANKSIPTAGVRVNPETAQFEMIYNPEFFEKLPENHVRGVLIHEFYHLIFDHVTSRMPDGVDKKQWNIATDLAINSIIGKDNLPSFVCIPGGKNFEDYPQMQAAEFYLEMLKRQQELDQQMQNGDGKRAMHRPAP